MLFRKLVYNCGMTKQTRRKPVKQTRKRRISRKTKNSIDKNLVAYGLGFLLLVVLAYALINFNLNFSIGLTATTLLVLATLVNVFFPNMIIRVATVIIALYIAFPQVFPF